MTPDPKQIDYIFLDSYYDQDDEPDTCNNQQKWDVQTTSSGYQIIIEDLPMFYYRFIIGSGGKKKKDIERSSNTRLFLPKIGEQGNVSKSFCYFFLNETFYSSIEGN